MGIFRVTTLTVGAVQMAIANPALAQAQAESAVVPPEPPQADQQMRYYDRQKIDISNLRDFYDGLLMVDAIIHADAMFDSTTKWKMTLFQMVRLGSRHYQARSAYQLSLMGVPIEDILEIWSPDYLDQLEDERLKAAYTYLDQISTFPSKVTADTHALLRTHYTDRQITELITLSGTNSPLARHDLILPIPTDANLLAWARANLAPVGWESGHNLSTHSEEQRAHSFTGDALETAYQEILNAWQPEDLGAPSPQFRTDWINYLTGYDVSRVTFDGDKDGIEEPFDAYPEDYSRWEDPSWDSANRPPEGTPAFDIKAYDYSYYRRSPNPETQYPPSDRMMLDTEWTRMASLGTSKIESHFSYVDRALTMEEKWPILLVFQLATGCGHCQAHAAFGYFDAVEDDYPYDTIPPAELPRVIARIHALFDFERSDLFSDAQKAAYRFARDAASFPTRTTAAHIEELRRHYSDREIQEIIETVIAGSWLASDIQSELTVTDRLAMAWSLRNLTSVGWTPGVHIGLPNEMRVYHMTEMSDHAMAEASSGTVIDGSTDWIGVDVPLGVDQDGDGVEDGFDGFPDDPSRWADTDRDGVEDGLDEDIDGDGLANAQEREIGTFPYKSDSDGDGLDDAAELKTGTDPVNPRSF
ncbi:MAG: hypothetical protein AAGH57_01255 [Pseudomonadota bacterium]